MKIEFSEFKNCKLSTEEIIKNINYLENDKEDFFKYLYSLLFYTDIKLENEKDLEKIKISYLGYREGRFITMEM